MRQHTGEKLLVYIQLETIFLQAMQLLLHNSW